VCPPDDAHEPNQSIGAATPIALGSSIGALICSGNPDYFGFSATAGDTVAVDVTFTHASGNLDLVLYNSGGVQVAQSVSTDDDEHLEYTPPSSGSYYAAVSGVGGAQNSYTIAVGLLICPPDDANEPDDTLVDATPIASGDEVEGISCYPDDDLFRFTGTAGEQVQVDLLFTHARGDLDLYLLNSVGGVVDYSEGTVNNEHITYLPSSSGTYYIVVAPFGGAENTYALTATYASEPGCDDGESGVFPDVSADHPFCPDIEWLVAEGITGGFPDGGFHPSAAVTRQSMAAFLYRYAGSPAFTPPGTPSFTDVPASHPFYDEIEWLAASGVTGGFADGGFLPSAAVTRQSMAAFLYRYAGSPTFTPPGSPSFDDVALTHPFYDEIEWLASTAVTGGYPDGGFHPSASVSRQAMAAFLHRYDAL
jgi:hypothetical protein